MGKDIPTDKICVVSTSSGVTTRFVSCRRLQPSTEPVVASFHVPSNFFVGRPCLWAGDCAHRSCFKLIHHMVRCSHVIVNDYILSASLLLLFLHSFIWYRRNHRRSCGITSLFHGAPLSCVDHVKRNAFGNNSHFVCTNEQTRKEFNRLRPSKAAGPDGISPKALKMCSSQLCEIFCTIFNLSFQSGVVPDIWKSSCIVPVPKNNKEGSMNDLRPVALTSVAFKTCERIVLPQLKSFIHESLDPFQFAYQSNRSCEDALLVTINEVASRLDSKLSVKKKQS